MGCATSGVDPEISPPFNAVSPHPCFEGCCWKSALLMSPAHAAVGPQGRRQPMEAWPGQFHNASRGEDGRSIVLQAHEAVGETTPAPPRPRGTAPQPPR